jgi:hypothetical protein
MQVPSEAGAACVTRTRDPRITKRFKVGIQEFSRALICAHSAVNSKPWAAQSCSTVFTRFHPAAY